MRQFPIFQWYKHLFINRITGMKAIEQKNEEIENIKEINTNKQDQNNSQLSVSVDCTSGYQDSIEQYRNGRYYASFSFKFKSKTSSDKYSFISDGQQMRMEEFFDDDVIFQKKVQKREVFFRPGCLSNKFIKTCSQLIYKFTISPDQHTFNILLQQISVLQIPIFQQKHVDQSVYTINQALQDLFYRKEHTFLIYTFDWSICHLTFVCCLLIYWMQIQIGSPVEECQKFNKNKQDYINLEKIKLKQNVCYIALSYCEERSQEINANQPVLLVLYNFLNYLKRQPCLDIVEISRVQDKLISDIKLFRRIKRKEKQFSQPNNQIIIQSQLKKYQFENKFITCQQKTYTLLKLICSHNFVSCPLSKYYQLDNYKESRISYQAKKDYFCLWMLNIILNQCQSKSTDSIHNASLYVLSFFVILKKMQAQCNLQGISYLVPLLANVQLYLPKVWKHVKERRHQIDKKLTLYTQKLTKKEFKTQQLSQGSVIIWNETIYQMTDKMKKFLTTQQFIELEEHKKFYQQFLVHFLHYRRNVQKQYREQIQKYDKQKQIGSSFNMYLLDSYVPKLFEGKCLEKQWEKFKRRAESINSKISNSLYKTIINYCFVGSTVKFQKMDI